MMVWSPTCCESPSALKSSPVMTTERCRLATSAAIRTSKPSTVCTPPAVLWGSGGLMPTVRPEREVMVWVEARLFPPPGYWPDVDATPIRSPALQPIAAASWSRRIDCAPACAVAASRLHVRASLRPCTSTVGVGSAGSWAKALYPPKTRSPLYACWAPFRRMCTVASRSIGASAVPISMRPPSSATTKPAERRRLSLDVSQRRVPLTVSERTSRLESSRYVDPAGMVQSLLAVQPMLDWSRRPARPVARRSTGPGLAGAASGST
mmetsp:Transcript_34493/g.103295  ORF Transcript_34493/g.103295 Transcript_34493/m.103295 type:complete len:265 (+) Transcript_34493:4086-4880(+)